MKKKISLVLVLTLGFAMETASADFVFGDVETLTEPINTPGISSGDLTMTADGLEAYFVSINRPGGYGGEDIWVCRRQSKEDGWGSAVNLGPPVNTSACEGTPCISADGLELYFSDVGVSSSSYRPGGHGGGDIWVAKRKKRDENWGNPVNLGPTINSSSMETYPNISTDGLSLFFGSRRPGGYGSCDVYMVTRTTKDDDWGTPVNVGVPPNTSSFEGFPNISADGLVLLFYSDRSGGYGGMDIYMSMRPTVSDDWRPAVNLGPIINTPYYDLSPSLSDDGSTLHFATNDVTGWVGNYKIYRTTISPVVDLNGDGIVDAADMCIIVDNWGTDEPLCDIGPMPWGDGIIDVEDLKVLAVHLFEEVIDPTLIAHWPLDESEGMVVADSAGNNDGYTLGDPIWLTDGGQVNGALEFDGVDDFISAPAVLNPADGPFSAFAWIQGGAPEQVIISQADGIGTGETWLGLDAQNGNLMTRLMSPPLGRIKPEPLVSQVVITDDQWHHVGFVWDGSYRVLYADGIEVAKDATAQNTLKPTTGGLCIGANKTLGVETFFSGLIDDVRIYDRALTPEEIAALAQ